MKTIYVTCDNVTYTGFQIRPRSCSLVGKHPLHCQHVLVPDLTPTRGSPQGPVTPTLQAVLHRVQRCQDSSHFNRLSLQRSWLSS